MMNHIEGLLNDKNNACIYHQAWLPEGAAKAVLLVVHGLGEHSGRYLNVVNHFVPLGYAVYALDHIGHGKSEGIREYVERFEDYTDTLTLLYNQVQGWQPGKPIFLLGHSMGGLIACYYLLEHPDDFKGAVISAPVIKIGANISPATIRMGKILARLAPKAGVLALDASLISRDPAVVNAYVNDPLVFHAKTTARLSAELLKAMLRVSADLHKITVPFIAVQGSEDKLVDPAGAQMLYDKAGSTDKTLRIYPGFFHEVFNEPGRLEVLKEVETWLEARI